MSGLSNYDYLKKHKIITLECLVGKNVFFVFPTQGIREEKVRKIEYTNTSREWLLCCSTTNRISELGNTIFLDYEEAHEYQLSKLKEYTQQQRERFLRREHETRKKELLELERLLKKYPDEESRKLPVENCSTCANNLEYPPAHTCDICTSLDQEEYSMWKEKYEKSN